MSHPVKIAPFQASELPLDAYSSLAVLVDEHTKAHCYPLVSEQLPEHTLIEIQSGEEHKNLQTCAEIWAAMTAAKLDRKSLMLNLGGGVIGDMGGFCAATYQRGIDFIQIPTTLLAQVDASVGGKLGIDFQGLKNQIGMFRDPVMVWVDPDFLQTLPERELRSGFAEVIKHCLIQDAEKWAEISQKSLLEQNFPDLIAHSVEIKRQIVTEDPTEQGKRKLLNFGHTIGHAVETYFLESEKEEKLLHGEAIAVGMIAESWISWQRKMISEADFKAVKTYIESIFGTVQVPSSAIPTILNYTKHDKKNERKKVFCSLLEGQLGQATFGIELSEEEIRAALEKF
ncbi:MAG: 3-dehydroquinate synthase [Bacteroidota bacterium]